MVTKLTPNLKNKKVLITAGPTWVNIDGVRIISNIATGQTGILLAQEARRRGAEVTLLLGPVNHCCLDKSIRVLHFKFFDELKNSLIKELSAKRYDAFIHSAAVSDYQPRKIFKNKLNSALKKISLTLVPTPKLVDLAKKINSSVLAVAFKFEPGSTVNRLISRAKALTRRAHLDLAVANSSGPGIYRAYILDRHKITGPIGSKPRLAKELIKKIGEHFGRN